MNNIVSFNVSTPDEVAAMVAARAKARRQYETLDDVLNENGNNRKRGKTVSWK